MTLASNAWAGKAELSWQIALAIPVLCLAAAAAMSLLPAAAAARVDPAEILREQ